MTFTPDPKIIIPRSASFLKFIRSKPCEVPYCNYPAVAAHVRKSYFGAGSGKKPWDWVAISLCDNLQCSHHKELDRTSLESFEKTYNIDIKRIIINNLIEFHVLKMRG